MSEMKPTIKCFENGPYLLKLAEDGTTAANLHTINGQTLKPDKGLALCRCGKSANKPYCDGTHKSINFSDAREVDDSANRRESYQGQQITIHDNRSICAHAGVCTDQLSSVFRMGQEPWIDPDGASIQSVIDLVKRCPSGAIDYSIDRQEVEDNSDSPSVTVIKNGPYAVCGVDLEEQPLAEGVSSERYTLCRCGASKNKPFCDGSHWDIGFKDEDHQA